MIHRALMFCIEMLLVAAAVFLADYLQSVIEFIPSWLIRLPDASYSRADFWTVFQYFMVVHALVFLVCGWLCGPWKPAEPRRTVDEAFAVAFGFAMSSLLVFVTTTVSFDPQFVVGIVVCAEVLVLVVHVGARVMARHGILEIAGGFFRAFFRRTFSIPGVIVLLTALSPGILAKLFVSDRDVANVITQIRIMVASVRPRDWSFLNALGEQTFAQPLLVRFAPGDDDTIFVLERGGRILSMPFKGGGTPRVVLDIRDKVGFVEVENGALGFAFHPQFGRGREDIYLYYTSVHEGSQVNRLSRFSLAGDSAPARSRSEEVLIHWDRPDDGFHNGGSVEFGPDGFLYLAVGEMSIVESHQSISRTLSSGILRIDVDKQGEPVSRPVTRQPVNGRTQGYFIPTDNPFVDVDGALGEFWAIGLRNPFRISFDAENDNLWVGEVGSTVWEEINLVRKGHNYEFPFREGREDTGKARPENVVGELSGPVFTYRHTAYDRAAIGGVVYRGSKHLSLKGQYLFGDNYSGKIFAFPASGDAVEQVREIAQANQFAQRGIASFAVSPDGEILVTTLGKASAPSGEVLKLVRASEVEDALPASTGEIENVSSEEVAALFTTNCGRCHGESGKGDGPDAAQMNVAMPDMSVADFLEGRDRAHLEEVIRDGGPSVGLSPMMPPWGKLFSDAELDALVDYVQNLSDASE